MREREKGEAVVIYVRKLWIACGSFLTREGCRNSRGRKECGGGFLLFYCCFAWLLLPCEEWAIGKEETGVFEWGNGRAAAPL